MTAMLLFMCLWLLDFSIAFRKEYGVREKGSKKENCGRKCVCKRVI